MDSLNRFESRGTHGLGRAEHVLVLVVCLGLLWVHRADVHWGGFLLLFALVDLIGTLPGALLERRGRVRGGARPVPGEVPAAVPRACYVLYNAAHSLPGCALLALGWWAVAGLDWTPLALALHLAADRGLLGNGFKPRGVPFTPSPLPEFLSFERALARRAERAPIADPGSSR